MSVIAGQCPRWCRPEDNILAYSNQRLLFGDVPDGAPGALAATTRALRDADVQGGEAGALGMRYRSAEQRDGHHP
jgi:hypothetical protein